MATGNEPISLLPPATSVQPGAVFPIVNPGGQTQKATIAQILLYVTPQQFGAKGNGVADDTAAILAAEASLTAGQVLWFPAGTYKFTSALSSTRQRFSWQGEGFGQSILLYAGASTTINLFTLGDGVTAVLQAFIDGLTLQSKTIMTGGTAALIQSVARSQINLDIQGQDGFATYGNTLYNGIWFEKIDAVIFQAALVFAQATGVAVNGDASPTGLKAGLAMWGDIKIGECAVGLHVGGGFGGLYLGTTEFSTNGVNILIDQALTAQANREIVMTGTISDVTTSGSGMVINDAGGLLLQASNCWFSSAALHGVDVQVNNGRLMFTGCRFYQDGQNAPSDGIHVAAAAAQVQLVGCELHNNTRYGINPAVANNNVMWGNCLLRDNMTAAVNLTFPGLIPYSSYWEQIEILNVADQITFGNSSFYAQLQGGTPVLAWAGNYFFQFVGGVQLNMVMNSQIVALLFNEGIAIPAGFVITTEPAAFASLPSPSAAGEGARAFVTDATLAYSGANVGAAVVGGSTHHTPVVVIGSAWVIG